VLLIRNIEEDFLPLQSNNVRRAWPMCQSPVPAESTVNLVVGSFDAKIPSAKGDRQIFPNKPLKIFTDIMCLER
jgi:hypothetical protein